MIQNLIKIVITKKIFNAAKIQEFVSVRVDDQEHFSAVVSGPTGH